MRLLHAVRLLVFLSIYKYLISLVYSISLEPVTNSFSDPNDIFKRNTLKICSNNNNCSGSFTVASIAVSRGNSRTDIRLDRTGKRSVQLNIFPPPFLTKLLSNVTSPGLKILSQLFPSILISSKNVNSQNINPTTSSIFKNIVITTSTAEDLSKNNVFSSPNALEEQIKTPTSDLEYFMFLLNRFDLQFYKTTFNKLVSISPPERQENGISFVQSGIFLYLVLLALSTEVDAATKEEIETCLGIRASSRDKTNILRHVLSWMPDSGNDVRFRRATRLVLTRDLRVRPEFVEGSAAALNLHLDRINGTEPIDVLTKRLNGMVELDSGGAMHDTFDEDDLSEGVSSVLLTTLYVRARWRSAPTVLNGTRPFRDNVTPRRSVRMIRINDIMNYADLKEWDAEAIEISYAKPGLTLLLLIPRGPSLKRLAKQMSSTNAQEIVDKMHTKRIAANLPIYTLRMTLLLPGKLKTMGMGRLVDGNKTRACWPRRLRLSHAVQRLMFWAEAGRNAFKDDGIEWDETPEKEVVVDRPYLFYVRWKNVTIMNGNFVL